MVEATTRLYFPADLGKRPSERGQKPAEESYAVTLTSDLAGKAPTQENIPQNKDLLFDQFGMNNTKNRKLLYADVNRYGLDLQDWDVSNSFTDSFVEQFEGVHPGLATNIENMVISYETDPSIATVFFESSGIQTLLPASNLATRGTRQALLVSKRRFHVPSGSPVFFTMGVRCVGQGENFIKQWGAFSSNTGFFMESIGDGAGDNLRIVRRYVEAGIVKNQLTPRSQWADPLDGTGTSKAFVSITNVTMWGFQISASDGGVADCYVYCEDGANSGVFRWIKFATVGAADSDFLRTIMEEGLPITFSNIGLTSPSTDQLLAKYGVSVTLSGDKEGMTPSGNGSVATSGMVRRDISATAIAMLEAKALVNNRPMSSIVLPVQLSAFSEFPVMITLVLNPTNDPMRSRIVSNYYANYLVEYYSLSDQVFDGQAIASFPVFGQGTFDLRNIFARVRAIMGAQFNNPYQVEGSSDFLAVLAQSRLYVVATPLVPGYNTPAIVPGLATNTEELLIEYAAGSPPTITPNIQVNLSIFFEDF
jgi:hypothetical protein